MKMYLTSYKQEMNQQQEAINTNCINHTQDWTLENTHSHKELLKYGTIYHLELSHHQPSCHLNHD